MQYFWSNVRITYPTLCLISLFWTPLLNSANDCLFSSRLLHFTCFLGSATFSQNWRKLQYFLHLQCRGAAGLASQRSLLTVRNITTRASSRHSVTMPSPILSVLPSCLPFDFYWFQWYLPAYISHTKRKNVALQKYTLTHTLKFQDFKVNESGIPQTMNRGFRATTKTLSSPKVVEVAIFVFYLSTFPLFKIETKQNMILFVSLHIKSNVLSMILTSEPHFA